MSWATGQPIYGRLPGENEAYQKDRTFESYNIADDIAYWLVAYWDELLLETKATAEDFHTDYLDPETARADALDWLAQFAGYTGNYWDSEWPESAKRALIANAYSQVWPMKGTRELLEWLLSSAVFNLEARVFILGDFLAGISQAGDVLGSDPFTFFILVDLDYLRVSSEWRLIEQLRQLFTPIYCESRVCFEEFYAGFSVAGDPVFS